VWGGTTFIQNLWGNGYTLGMSDKKTPYWMNESSEEEKERFRSLSGEDRRKEVQKTLDDVVDYISTVDPENPPPSILETMGYNSDGSRGLWRKLLSKLRF
jgi:hypothetical protein